MIFKKQRRKTSYRIKILYFIKVVIVQLLVVNTMEYFILSNEFIKIEGHFLSRYFHRGNFLKIRPLHLDVNFCGQTKRIATKVERNERTWGHQLRHELTESPPSFSRLESLSDEQKDCKQYFFGFGSPLESLKTPLPFSTINSHICFIKPVFVRLLSRLIRRPDTPSVSSLSPFLFSSFPTYFTQLLSKDSRPPS